MINLKRIRKSRGYSQAELAKKLNVTQGAINFWENGDREPNLKTLKELAVILECEPWQLLPDDMHPSFFRKDMTLEIDYGVMIYNEANILFQQTKKLMDLVRQQAKITNQLLDKYNNYLDGVENED